MYSAILSSADLARNLYNPDWVVLDCRTALGDKNAGRRAFKKGHIPGAQYLSLEADMSGPACPQSGRHPLPAADDFLTCLQRLGVNELSQVVTYDDRGGAFAARAWWMLKWIGHEAVAVLDGGLPGWLKHGRKRRYSLETGPATPRPMGDLTGQAKTYMTVSAPYILAHLNDPNLALIDARSRDRFNGKTEPIDPVAGHIPGALNYPFSGNLDQAGYFIPAADLKSRFANISSGDVVNMCGSGVTACHNILARTLAGLPPGRLYTGSWSGWISDNARPIVT